MSKVDDFFLRGEVPREIGSRDDSVRKYDWKSAWTCSPSTLVSELYADLSKSLRCNLKYIFYLITIVCFVASVYLISCYLTGVLKTKNFKTN